MSKSKFKVEFSLKQHTPIIHFQSEQSGATLRATELKPKLDRFLLENVEGIPFKENANGSKSLDYKVKIEANGKTLSDPNESLFFANSLLDNKMKAVMAHSVKVEFFSFNKIILQSIKDLFEEFILISNFGMRSSKGFGSFSEKNFTGNTDEIFKRHFSSVFKVENITSRRWAAEIDKIHKRLKAGTNYGGYNKSLLFRYLCDIHGLRWEKRNIKQKFPNVIRPSHKQPVDCSIVSDDKFRFVRAMLGLAGNYEYNGGPKKGGEIIEVSSKDIERFQSPITYKFINETVYILGDNSYEALYSKEFNFALGSKSFNIKTPSKDEFSLYGFLQYVEKNENLINEVK